MFEKKPHAFLHSTGRTMTFAHLLIYLFLGILLSGCGDSTESANLGESLGMDSIREDVFKANYGERDPIANMANISALVSEKLNVDRDVNWVGFYLMKRNSTLIR